MMAGGTGITPCWQVVRAVCEDPEDTTQVRAGGWALAGSHTGLVQVAGSSTPCGACWRGDCSSSPRHPCGLILNHHARV